MLAAEAHETTQLPNRQSPEYVTPPVSPRHPSPEHIPPAPAQEQEIERASPAPAQTVPTDPIPTTNDTPVTVLHGVNPEKGPTSGGITISLYVSNLEPGTRVFLRFGCNKGTLAVRYFECYSRRYSHKNFSIVVTIFRERYFVLCLQPHNLALLR